MNAENADNPAVTEAIHHVQSLMESDTTEDHHHPLLRMPPLSRLLLWGVLLVILLPLLHITTIMSPTMHSISFTVISLVLAMVLAGLWYLWQLQIQKEKRSRQQLGEYLAATLALSQDGVVLSRMSDGMLISASPGFAAMTGYTREELMGKTSLQLGLWPDYTDRQRYIKQFQNRQTLNNFRMTIRDKQGEDHQVVVSGAKLNQNGETLAVTVIRDINEEVKLRERNAEQAQLLRRVTDNLPVFLARFDHHLRYLYVNETLSRTTGRKTEDFLGKTMRTLDIPADFCDRWERKVQHVFATGEPQTDEFSFENEQGKRHYQSWLSPEFDPEDSKRPGPPQVNSVVSLTIDITESHEMLEQLTESRESYRFLTNHATDIISRHDAEGKILYISPAAERLLGYDCENLLGQTLEDLVHAENLAQYQRAQNRLLERPRTVTISYRLKRNDGGYSWFESTGQSVCGEDGRVREIVMVSRDVSDRKTTEMALAWELEVNASMAMLSQAAASGISLQELMELTVDTAAHITRSEQSCACLRHTTSDATDIIATRPRTTANNPEHPLRCHLGNPDCLDKQTSHEPIMLNDPNRIQQKLGPCIGQLEINRLLCVQIMLGDESVGAISVLNGERDYDGRDLEAIERMAELLSLVVARKRAETQSHELESRYFAAARSSLDCLYLLRAKNDADGNIVDFTFFDLNERGAAMLSRTREQVIDQDICQLLPVIQDEGHFDIFRDVYKTSDPIQHEFEIHAEDQGITAQWIQYQVVPLTDGVAVAARDVTERKRDEEELRHSREHYRQAAESNRRLLAEVNHRVRNNLGGLLGLVRMTARNAQTVESFADSIKSRISAMAQIHNLLAHSSWNGISLRSMINALLGNAAQTSQHSIPVNVSGPQVQIDARQATPLAMTLSELFANSLKHGAHSSATGEIDISWSLKQPEESTETSASTILKLRWRERGGPKIKLPIQPSLGTQLIEGFIRFELNGICDLHFEKEGIDHTLSIPLEEETSDTTSPGESSHHKTDAATNVSN